MAKFLAKWRLEGLTTEPVEAGETVEAKFEDVKHLVAQKFGGNVVKEETAVLEPVDKTDEAEDEATSHADVNLQKLSKADLVAHADEHHDLTLDPNMKKDEMVAAIETARAAEPQS